MVIEDFDAHRKGNGRAVPWPTVSAAVYADKETPQRAFLDDARLLPMRNVVLLYGNGGVGKSLLALQLALACTTATNWIGIGVTPGAVLYFNAEDDEIETQIRLHEICEAEGIDLAEASGLQFMYMAGLDTALVTENPRSGSIKLEPLYDRLEATMAHIGPVAVILDNLADVYAGNENNRNAVKHFIGKLRTLAMRHDCVIVLLAHPSLQGMSTGTGTSGSTAWSNSVRSRLYLHKPDNAVDEDTRLLENMKANYGRTGKSIGLKWFDHRFVRKDAEKPFDHVRTEHVDQVAGEFSRGQWRTSEQSDDWGGYYVAGLIDLDVGPGVLADERTAQQKMNRNTVRVILHTWLASKVIKKVMRQEIGGQRKKREFFSGA